MATIEALQTAIDRSQNLVFFGGAGVSTASGIPDFRSANGVYSQATGNHMSPEEIISHDFFKQYPAEFYDFYFKHLVYPEAKPNVVHKYLAQLEARGKDLTIVTQNIDGLHQAAGSQKVVELHGSVHRNYCLACGRTYNYENLVLDQEGIPRCPFDGGLVRPDVVLYQEQLDQTAMLAAMQAISQADMMIVAGTSLVVYPAAAFIQYFQGQDLAVINKTPLKIRTEKVLDYMGDMKDIFQQLH
ncbi:NAD-dependent protein deacylase [Eremococcus coleocola]|uniref:protein acetyllysine N-acetyltransferase n=1 Tax=Eremococcus coleocola ACS-139-V-Col8 TaxID=908337 RepID=E4KP46_9LACT|nr:NAD-dependent protein deacylase [Eremococcus coleocola]EFR31251.1 transcriptional regulator, Sir2 family [Eremococcus coleocola ACS-139-V-Col8]